MSLIKLEKVTDSITVTRCDNGWMIEIGGWNTLGVWSTAKVICATDQELHALINEYKYLSIAN